MFENSRAGLFKKVTRRLKIAYFAVAVAVAVAVAIAIAVAVAVVVAVAACFEPYKEAPLHGTVRGVHGFLLEREEVL